MEFKVSANIYGFWQMVMSLPVFVNTLAALSERLQSK